MTDKQRKFADEYLVDCNATRAYKAAYPRVKNDDVAATNGGRLLRNAEIKTYIEKKLEEISSAKIADAKEVMEYLTSVMRGDSESTICVVENIGNGYSKAAELIGKRFGLYTDKLDVESAIPIVITGEDALAE